MMRLHFASTKDPDMFYALGQPISDPVFYIEHDTNATVILNKLEIDAFREHNTRSNLTASPLEPFLEKARQKPDGSFAGRLAETVCQHFELTRHTISVPRHFPLDMTDHLRHKKITLEPQVPFFPERERKNAQEIEYIRHNTTITRRAFERIEAILASTRIENGILVGQSGPLTSEYIKDDIAHYLLSHEMVSEDGIIIAAGEQSALPHHHGSGVIPAHVPIICDIFPRHQQNGYVSDMTRTYLTGNPSGTLTAMQQAVDEAKHAAINRIAPDVSCAEVHKAAADTLREHGFESGTERGFIHGTGHGIGLEVHEEPRVSPRSEQVLEPGHVVTIEPGLYYAEHGGVRSEDVVIVTENGHTVL